MLWVRVTRATLLTLNKGIDLVQMLPQATYRREKHSLNLLSFDSEWRGMVVLKDGHGLTGQEIFLIVFSVYAITWTVQVTRGW